MIKKKNILPKVAVHTVFIFFSLLCLIPLLLIVSISITNEKSLLEEGYRLIPKQFSLKSYAYVLGGANSVIKAYGVTIFVTVVGTFLHLLVSSMLAYSLTRPEVKQRNKISLYVYIPVLFNGGLIPYYMMITQVLRIKDTIFVLIAANILSAVNVLIMKNFFQTIPNTLIESARIDGASEYRTFFKIVLPLSTPSLATIGLFVAIAYWNDWMTCSLYIENQNLLTLQYLLQSLMSNLNFLQSNPNASQSVIQALGMLPNESARMTTCVLSIGPIILLYPFLQKYFEKGLTIGAVKG